MPSPTLRLASNHSREDVSYPRRVLTVSPYILSRASPPGYQNRHNHIRGERTTESRSENTVVLLDASALRQVRVKIFLDSSTELGRASIPVESTLYRLASGYSHCLSVLKIIQSVWNIAVGKHAHQIIACPLNRGPPWVLCSSEALHY